MRCALTYILCAAKKCVTKKKGNLMKCLVFSDSHGDAYYINQALRDHPDAELVFFLGDGLSDIEPFVAASRKRCWLSVRGNCDFREYLLGESVPKTDEITVMGKKIVITHGDLYSAKLGMDKLIYLAEERCADIVLFGHTHRAEESYISVGGRGVWFFNPGSVSTAYGNRTSYGILTLDEKSVLFSVASLI